MTSSPSPPPRKTICSNQYSYSGNTTQLAVQCVASWQLTQQQVRWSVYAFGGLVVFSGLWHLLSKRQKRRLDGDKIGFSLRLRHWGKTSRFAIIMNRPVQLLVSIGIIICMGYTCNSYEVTLVRYYIMTSLYAISLVDDAIRFCASHHKLFYCLSLYTILEILCIMSHLQVGYAPAQLIDMGAGEMVESRTWLEFSIMRPIFVYRSYLEMERNVPKSSKGWMMARLGMKVFLLICFGASVMFFLETLGELPFFTDNGFAHLYSCPANGTTVVTKNPSPYPPNSCTETWSVMFAYYFTIVTLGTVGYGDMAPKTVLSRLLAIMFIVGGVILFSMEIDHLIGLYKSRQIGNPPYMPRPNAEHVVIAGNPTFAQLSSILRELFHEDHGEIYDDRTGAQYKLTHAVVLGERKCHFTKPLIAKLEADPIFAARVTYVAGSATNAEDLDRCELLRAKAAFVFPNKLSGDPSYEDSRNIMRVLAIKRHVHLGLNGPEATRFRCLVVVLRVDSIRHVLASGVDRDDIVCENLVKMTTLSQGVRAKGISTMLANLASSLSVDTSIGGDDDCTATEEHKNTPFTIWRARRRQKRRNSLRASNDDFQISVEIKNEQMKSVTLMHSKRRWLQNYYEGAAKEMYQITLAKRFVGFTFAMAVLQIFKETNGEVVLIAVEMGVNMDPNNDDEIMHNSSRVLLNPGSSLVISEGIQVYVIADDLDQIVASGICMDEDWDHVVHDDLGDDHFCLINDKAGTPPPVTEEELAETPPSGKSDQAYQRLVSPNSGRSLESGNFRTTNSKRALLTMSKIKMDPSLEKIANEFRQPDNNTILYASKNANGSKKLQTAMNNCLSIYAQKRPILSLQSTRSLHGDRLLKTPPLEVLFHPKHIVVCSFLGEEALASLQWFLFPLRNYFNREFVPVTILDSAVPSVYFMDALSVFDNVYYVQGSPLSYQDLQRAGAKSAYGVVILSKKKTMDSSAGEKILSSSTEEPNRGTDEEMESSIADAEAIFSTMLVRLKMDFSRVFTITELTDEANSKFMSMPFQDGPSSLASNSAVMELRKHDAKTHNTTHPDESVTSWWDQILSHDLPKQMQSEQAIFGIPLYMSGRLLHPHLCENMLVQTFFNRTIHKIMRQLVGGPNSTGIIQSCALPYRFRRHVDTDGVCCTFGQVFQEFVASKYSRVVLGIYRMSTQDLWSGVSAELPIVLTAPKLDTPLFIDDQLFVLVGTHTLERSAHKLQHFFSSRCKKKSPPADHGALVQHP